MATDILLPKIGFSVTEATLTEWLASDGAEITQGDPLMAVESEKSTNEIESPATGKLKIIAEAGETYEVGTLLGRIE